MMKQQNFYNFLNRQVVVLVLLTLIPGLAYVFLGWINNVIVPALIWYTLVMVTSIWGWKLYSHFRSEVLSNSHLKSWYRELKYFYYVLFSLWTLAFLLYCNETESKLHYIAIFTQIGASVVASTLLISDRNLYKPVLYILMIPLIAYFIMIGEWYGYILTIFSIIFLGVLIYSADNSYNLLQKNYHQAQQDALTGLHNRRYFVEYIEHAIKRIHKSKQFAYIMLIDLDHFKTINDSLGHEVGDKVLIEVASRMREYCGESHMISRLGGDEFTIISHDFDKSEHCRASACEFAEGLLKLLKEPYFIDRHHLYLSASIGLNCLGNVSAEASKFIREADIAMYEAKAQGRDGVIEFNEALAKRVEYHLEIERRLYFALENNQIELRFQPQVNRERKVVGCEVLIRWNCPEFGLVPHSEFITTAEKTGLIIELGHYIMEESFKTLALWEEKGVYLEQFSINLSVRQFFHSSFVDDVERLSEKYLKGRLIEKIVFEVTETILIEDMNRVVQTMNRLKSLGISFSMDDFGTGYSSLSSLRDLPIDELKVDRSFVSHFGERESDKLMIHTILAMAQMFNLTTVAEGVESEEQFHFLLENHCQIFQGHYFEEPLKLEAFENLVLGSNTATHV